MANVISVAMQKGGVGKTTIAIELSNFLAMTRYKTLLIDTEPQGNSSLVLLQKPHDKCLYHAFIENRPSEDLIRPSRTDRLDVMPSTPMNDALANVLPGMPGGEKRLLHYLEDNHLLSSYDFIVIDCPPALNYLTFNALQSSDFVIEPLECSVFGESSLALFKDTLDRYVRLSPKLKLLGAVINRYQGARTLTKEAEEFATNFFGDALFRTRIRDAQIIREAQRDKTTIFLYAPGHAVTEDFVNFCEEVLERIELHKTLMPIPSAEVYDGGEK
jgi:chromosome partitioning protein